MGKSKTGAHKWKAKVHNMKLNAGGCYFCRKELAYEEMTVEHLLPKSRGGTNAHTNLAIACEPCNNDKGSMLESEYQEYLSYINYLRGLSSSKIKVQVNMYESKFRQKVQPIGEEKRLLGYQLRALRLVQKERAGLKVSV